MIEALPDMPDGVLGFEAVGEVHAEDYVTTLVPAIEAQAGPVRLVYVLGERFDGYSSGAMWQDAKLPLQHHEQWHRLALVTDVDWVRHLAAVFGWMIPGKFEVFPTDRLTAAIAWVAED